MLKNIELNSETIFVSVRCKGATVSLPLNQKLATSARLKEPSLTVYEDLKLLDKVSEIKKFLANMSSKSMVTSPSSSTYPIPINRIAELKTKLDTIDQEVENDLEEIVANYDAVKSSNMAEIDKAIAHMSESERLKIKARAEVKYPPISVIKSKRQLLISIMASPLANGITGIDVLADRINDDVLERYKEAIFMSIDPIYKALGTYYTKLLNGQDIGTKSKNYFASIVKELKDVNKVRRDGFTENLLKIIDKYSENIFEDGNVCYIILLNIYNEANACDVLYVLTDLEKMERRLMKSVAGATFVLENNDIDEDAPNATPIKDLL